MRYQATIMEKELTTSEQISFLEKTIKDQRIHIEHLEDLHRMQALPPFFMLYIVDFEGPKKLVIPPDRPGEPRCMVCGEMMHNNDNGFEIETRRVMEMNDNIIINRTALIHSDCYATYQMQNLRHQCSIREPQGNHLP
jgi:hypothetical protein